MSDKPKITEEDMKRNLSARFGETPNVSLISEPITEKAEVE